MILQLNENVSIGEKTGRKEEMKTWREGQEGSDKRGEDVRERGVGRDCLPSLTLYPLPSIRTMCVLGHQFLNLRMKQT
jgi:hypothetical protein